MPEMVPVASSNISAIGFDDEKGELIVQFSSGSEYAYEGVDRVAFDDFLGSASKGKYFAAYIKDVYPTRRIT